ncbi:hypothetical protein [Leptospira kanakyensis]|uniref:Uncharacterized protein n=1 Tax=Leptospira kanakyensis TaxID=2484968 RepID=A0A6N4Q5U8_9LEPT|nr:hypothetical protein [Leptospira kanakyensis]TGK50803.1 hypothetical protein EHQ11_09255 [Leptospira kanakyensis]TGK58745.1 hypothetical protein EHQ16_13365 [Leptospira kanakyensis]TGK69940.1 hypothetical protein EHQ18_09415 [Leptospira kanakyensis]
MTMSLIQIKKQFLELKAPESFPVGNFKAEWIGPKWFQTGASFSLNFMSFRHWWGKSFDGSEIAYNLFLPPNKTEFQMRYPMNLSIGKSKIDEKPSLILEYTKNAPFPWPFFIDEFRILNQTDFLGMSYNKFTPKLALPFLIRKS